MKIYLMVKTNDLFSIISISNLVKQKKDGFKLVSVGSIRVKLILLHQTLIISPFINIILCHGSISSKLVTYLVVMKLLQ